MIKAYKQIFLQRRYTNDHQVRAQLFQMLSCWIMQTIHSGIQFTRARCLQSRKVIHTREGVRGELFKAACRKVHCHAHLQKQFSASSNRIKSIELTESRSVPKDYENIVIQSVCVNVHDSIVTAFFIMQYLASAHQPGSK